MTSVYILDGVEQPNILPKPPGNAVSDALLMSGFQNFVSDATKKKTTLCAILINEVLRINSGPKILRSCFLHWLGDEGEGV